MEELLRSPQNNLKIFKDGSVVYDQESSPSDLDRVLDEWFRNSSARRNDEHGRARVDEFCDLVCAALTRPYAIQEQPGVPAATVSRPCDFLPPANRVPTLRAEPDTIARVEKCLRLAGKVGRRSFRDSISLIATARYDDITFISAPTNATLFFVFCFAFFFYFYRTVISTATSCRKTPC